MSQTNTLVKAQKITSFKRSLAVVIGINDYQNKIPKLQTARRDAEVLAQILAKEHQYDEVILMTDETECKPTLKNLLTLLEEKLPKEIQLTKDDRLLFYFAGHGIARDSDKGPAGCLVPQDADLENNKNLLPMQKLHECLSALSCRHLLVILDCCFAGTFRWSTARLATVIPTVIRKEHYDRFIKSPAWQAITSAAHNQEALDILRDNRGGNKHSPFAEALFKALRGEGDVIPAAKNGKGAGDGVITATELYLYLRDHVETASNDSQTPGIWTLSRHDRGEYIFLVPGAEPKLKPAPKLTEKNNPYRGLQSFEEEHSQLFFGRKELVKELYEKISNAKSSLTVVLGISGSGKSSLVKAGLIPYLRQNHSREWYILKPMRPSESPFTALARTLLLITSNNDIVVSKQLDNLHFIDEILQQEITALNQRIDECDINSEEDEIIRLEQKVNKFERLAHIWKRGTKEAKQLLIVDNFDELNNLCRVPNEQRLLKEAVLNCLNPLSLRLHDSSEFIKIVKTWSEQRPGIRLLLVIDQFEELITLSSHSKEDQQNKQPNLTESQQFLKLLEATLAAHLPQLSIVVTLRSDFEPRFLNLEALKSHWTHARFPVRAMRSDELRQAIERPAAEMALYFEQLPGERNPVDKLVDEVGQMPGALPLLSFTLSELYIKLAKKWETGESSDRALTLDAEFDKEGGVAGSLTRKANQEYDCLPDDKYRDTMRRVMLRMVTVEGGESARRRVPLSELVYADKYDPSKRDDEENKRVELVLKRLIDARLVVSGQETGEAYVEPAHDFLVRSWDKLQKWQQQEQEDLALQRRLTPNALEWKNKEQSASVLGKAEPVLSWFDKKIDSTEDWFSKIRKDTQERQQEKKTQFLWNGNPYLEVLKKKLKSADYWFNQIESDFVQRSIWQRRRNVNLRWSIAIGVILGLGGLTVFALNQRNTAIARQLAAQAQLIRDQQFFLLPRSVLLSVEAMRRFPSLEADQALRSGLALLPRSVANMSHEDEVNAVAFSPDGKYLATASDDNTARVWNAASGKEVFLLKHEDKVNAVAFSPDGKYLATASDDNTARVWNAASGKEVFLLKHNPDEITNVTNITFSPDGKYLTTSDRDKTVKVWNATNGKEVFRLKLEYVGDDVVFSPNSKYLVTAGSDNAAWVWEVTSGKQVTRLQHEGRVSSVDFSPDGKYLATASWDKTAKVWEATSGKEIIRIRHDATLSVVAFSPDGKYLVTASGTYAGVLTAKDYVTRVLETTSGREVARMQNETLVSAVDFSPDSKYLATVSKDARVWELASGKEVVRLKPEDRVSAVAFSPDGKYLATGSEDKTSQLWEFTTGWEGISVKHEYAAISPDGKYVATVGGDFIIRVWETTTGREVTNMKHEADIWRIAFSPDGKYLATADEDKTTRVWEANSGKEVSRMQHEDRVWNIAFSPDGKYLATSYENNIAQVWQVTSGQEVVRLKDYAVESIAFSPDGKYLATLGSNIVRVWEVTTGKEATRLEYQIEQEFEGGGYGGTNLVTFSSDGKYLIAAKDSSGEAQVWEVFSGKIIARLKHKAFLREATVSPNEKYVATAGDDSIARVWEVSSGKEVIRLKHDRYDVWGIAFSPNSKYVATAGADYTARVWEVSSGREVIRLKHEAETYSVTFSPDSKYLITESTNQVVRVWSLSQEDLIADACSRLTRNLSREEWQQYLGAGIPLLDRYRKTCQNLPE
ncbi:hypothetical protein F7734_23195 [Scytonema sp. UIC 10036]|uniref:nSTAND1 domain-containing NTPase n=1 Tax=Scytonema sp. UIC 10036 TaxID=2304196 RepID=UPI0012DAF181|nr:caspase family protein [Scytonema sp. UIC 10036]MUG95108.1 hypothetical protein [Scytonema sp. UIC 10036]